jgi:cell division transport system ATP-binding protein
MIEFQDVTVCYEPQKLHPVRSLDALNLKIERGDWVFLVGPSGAGKSSLLKLIFAGTRAQSGRILVDGVDISALAPREVPALRRKLGIVFQDFQLLGEKTAWENVAFTLRVIGTPQAEIIKSVPLALETVGLTHRASAFPHELSGGEQQRIAIARAIVNNPKILLCDEPTGNLDPQTAREVGELLTKINRERGTTIVMATHDRQFVDTLARRVVRLQTGRVVRDENPGTYGDDETNAREITPFDIRNAPSPTPLSKPEIVAAPVAVPLPVASAPTPITPKIATAIDIEPEKPVQIPQTALELQKAPASVEEAFALPEIVAPASKVVAPTPEVVTPRPEIVAPKPEAIISAPEIVAPPLKPVAPPPIPAQMSRPAPEVPPRATPMPNPPSPQAAPLVIARPVATSPVPVARSENEEFLASLPAARPMARRLAPEEITAATPGAQAPIPVAPNPADPSAPLGSSENPIVQYE